MHGDIVALHGLRPRQEAHVRVLTSQYLYRLISSLDVLSTGQLKEARVLVLRLLK